MKFGSKFGLKFESKFSIWNAVGVAMVLVVGVAGGALATRFVDDEHPGYQDTPLVPGQKWHVHDSMRPHPPIIDPGTASTQDTAGKPPSDATVLFDGTDLSHWTDGGKPAAWKVENGYMEVTPKTGSIVSKDQLGDCQLHVEWSERTDVKGSSQGRGNSGVLFFGGKYEVQVLDSYKNLTYADGQAASIYGSWPPLVNAMRKPGEWQVYDILFTAPRFDGQKLSKPGYFTVFHNGVCVHNHVELLGETFHRKSAAYTPHGLTGPLMLQNHGDAVRYRNIWFRPLKDYDQP